MKIINHQLIATDEEIHKYCLQHKEYKKLKLEDRHHIIKCIKDIILWYNTTITHQKYANCILGHFLTAVINNDFIKATTNADETNYKCLRIYAKFIYNILPMNYLNYTEKT